MSTDEQVAQIDLETAADTLDELFQHGRLLLVRPDEALIFKFDARLTREMAEVVREQIAARLPGIRFLVIGDGIEVDVVRQEES